MPGSPPLMLAVDFSEASAAALKHTERLAERLDAKVVLVHAFSSPIKAPTLAVSVRDGPYVPILEAEAEMQQQEAQELTERWAQPLRDAGLDVEVVAQPGMATDIILAMAEKLKPEMVIMGRQGQGRLRRVVIGSQSRYVSEHSAFPVLLVPSA